MSVLARSATAAGGVPPFSRDRVVHGWLLVRGVSDAGDAAWTIALAWTAVRLADPAVAGLVVAAGTVPRAVTLLYGGVVADRIDTRTVLVATTVARVAVLGATIAATLLWGGSVPLLLAVAVAFGLCDALFEPAGATLGRQLVRERDLAAYAGAGQTASRLGTIVGAAAGGGLVAVGGLTGSALANAATYLVVLGYLVLVLRVRFPLARADREPVLRSIGAGFGYLRRDATARTLVLALSGLNLAVGPAYALGLALRVRESGWGAGSLGLLQALLGFGALCCAAAFVRWRPRREARLGLALLVAQAVAIATLAVPAGPATGAACVVIGVTAGGASTLLSAAFARAVAAEYLGRVSSILRLGDDVLMPGAMAAFGALAAGASLASAFMVFGGAMAGLMVATLARPAVRQLDEP